MHFNTETPSVQVVGTHIATSVDQNSNEDLDFQGVQELEATKEETLNQAHQ